MSATVWPPIAPHELKQKEDESLARELNWLLALLQETFASLKAGLEECAVLLSPDKGPITLVLSSQRSENLKGYVTRVGTRVVKGDISLRLPSLGPPPKGQPAHRLTISAEPSAPTLVLDQLTQARTLINTSLDVIDVGRWTGDAMNGQFISGQLRLLCDNLSEAGRALKGNPGPLRESLDGGERKDGEGEHDAYAGAERGPDWCEEPLDETIFTPPLPHYLSLHISIVDGALHLHVRTLAAAPTSHSTVDNLRERLFPHARPHHDEADHVYHYRGRDVVVREKLKVESLDPSLLAAMAKLSALEHGAGRARRALSTVMGVVEE